MPARRRETVAQRLLRNLNPEWICHRRAVKLDQDGEFVMLGCHRGHETHVFHLRIDRTRKRLFPLRRFKKVGNTLCPIDASPVPEDVHIEARIVLGADFTYTGN